MTELREPGQVTGDILSFPAENTTTEPLPPRPWVLALLIAVEITVLVEPPPQLLFKTAAPFW